MNLRTLPYPKILIAFWTAYFAVLVYRVIWWGADGLYVGHINAYLDWGLHIGLANTYAAKSPSLWFAYHPFFADGKMTYTFLNDFISGILMRAGVPLIPAFIGPAMLEFFFLVLGIYQLFIVLRGSKARACIGLCLFFCAAGLGFVDYFNNFFVNPKLHTLIPNVDYSRLLTYGWWTGNPITGYFLPQRAILLGMPLAIWALIGFFSVLKQPGELSPRSKGILIASGLGAGLLPIAHMHSLIAILLIGFPVAFANYRKWKILLYAGIPGGILSASLYFIFIYGGIENPHFMKWNAGYVCSTVIEWLGFWFSAWGLMIPAAIAGWFLVRKRVNRDTLLFLTGSFILFAIANLIQFQPTIWDNSKLFAWCYLLFSLLAAETIVMLWEKKSYLRPLSIYLFILLTLTGVIELVFLQQIRETYRLIDTEEITLAETIRARTPPLARFLSYRDYDDFIMVWAARPIVMGYEPWVVNDGFLCHQTELDRGIIYHGEKQAISLLRQHNISYVVIGPDVIKHFHPNEEFFHSHFPIVFQSSNYRIYDVRNASGDESQHLISTPSKAKPKKKALHR